MASNIVVLPCPLFPTKQLIFGFNEISTPKKFLKFTADNAFKTNTYVLIQLI